MWPLEEKLGGRQGGRKRSCQVNNTYSAVVFLALLLVILTTLQSVSASPDRQRLRHQYTRQRTTHVRQEISSSRTTSRRRNGLPAYYWSRTHRSWSQYSQRPSHIGPLPHINEVMSEWSNWSSWGRCSRSCGGGVRSRTRSCVTKYPRVMPGSGVRTSHDRCAGESAEYGVCGTTPCSPGQVSALSFRASQCRRYNNRRVFGRIVNNWIPYTQGGINPCALVCEGEGEGIVYTFGKVTDGTFCKTTEDEEEGSGRNGLCVNGRCLRVSCDGRLGGGALEDMCRVCGGHNETCTRHSGVFHMERPAADQPKAAAQRSSSSSSSSSPSSSSSSSSSSSVAGMLRSGATEREPQTPQSLGYHEVAFIPKGATNVKATDHSANFLALKAGNKYILNGDWLIDWPGDVEAGGTSFSYSRAQDESETLFALGPTTEDLTLMVLLREHNPGIHYEYWTPNILSGHLPFNIPLQTKSFSRTDVTTTPSSTSTGFPLTSTSSSSDRRASTTPRPAVITNIDAVRQHLSSGYDVPQLNTSRKEAPEVSTENNQIPPPEAPLEPPPHLQPSTDHQQNLHHESRTNISDARLTPSSTTSLISSSSSSSDSSPFVFISPESTPREGPRGSKHRGVKDKAKEKQDRRERRKKKKKKKTSKKKEEDMKKGCGPCKRVKRAKENFCTSDFVSRVEVESTEELGSEMRHVVLIHQSYKNTVPLLHKEFLWVDNTCRCPRLRPGRTYLLMGRTETSRGGREVRLVVGEGSYVRRYKPRALAKIMRLRRDEMKYCRPWRRNLRFVQQQQHQEDPNDILAPQTSSEDVALT